MTLSVAIVCKSNEATIGRTLDSVRGLADEIVAVDSGSTDRTIDLLEAADARVIRTDWKGYVATKQMALDACTRDWVLCLDSDESLDTTLAEEIRRFLANPGQATAARMNRKVFYNDRPLNHAWQPEWRTRLVRRGLYRWAGLDPHDYLESINPDQQAAGVATLRGTLRHDSISTFADFRRKQVSHARTMARSMQLEGRRGSLLRLITSPAGAFLKQMVLKRAFLDGWPGVQAAYSTAYATALKHAALLRLRREEAAKSKPTTVMDR